MEPESKKPIFQFCFSVVVYLLCFSLLFFIFLPKFKENEGLGQRSFSKGCLCVIPSTYCAWQACQNKRMVGPLLRGIHFSEPAPKRGGMGSNYFHSPRDGPVSPRKCSLGSSNKSPSKSPLSSPSQRRNAGACADSASIASCRPARRRGGGIVGKAEARARAAEGAGSGSKKGKRNEAFDDDGAPKLIGRPEKWNISQHDLNICQWSGFGWAQCEVCGKWRKPSVSGVDMDISEGDPFVCSDMGARL